MIVKLVATTELRDTSFGYVTHWEQCHPEGRCEDEPEEFLTADGLVTDDLGESLDSTGGGFILNPEWEAWFREKIPTDADELGELAGRLCYLSWDRPNPKTASNAGYIANIIAKQHFSVLEHASATFFLGGVSRSFTHELVRHRHLSFSQVSQRYVDEGLADHYDPGDGGGGTWDYVVPPILRYDADGRKYLLTHAGDPLHEAMGKARQSYDEMVKYLTEHGVPRKQARGAARSVLPNATATQILVTGNLRAFRDMLQKRLSPGADAEFQLVAKEILKHLLKLAPNSFADMEELADG